MVGMNEGKKDLRPSDVYGTSYSRETLMTHIQGSGYKPIAFRVPRAGEWYMKTLTYTFAYRDPNHTGPVDPRIIVERL